MSRMLLRQRHPSPPTADQARRQGDAGAQQPAGTQALPPEESPSGGVFAARHGSPAWPVCADATVHPGEGGAPGWERGINFNTLQDVIGGLHAGTGRLGISCHGGPPEAVGALVLEDDAPTRLVTADRLLGGLLSANVPEVAGRAYPHDADLHAPYSTWDLTYFTALAGRLVALRGRLVQPATVIFVSCSVAATQAGQDLLSLLAVVLHASVVGFATTIDADAERRSGGCYVPGGRVTDRQYASGTHPFGELPYRLTGWATEAHPNAYVATPDGRITVGGRVLRHGPEDVTDAAGFRAPPPLGAPPIHLDARALQTRLAELRENRNALVRTGGFFGSGGRRRRADADGVSAMDREIRRVQGLLREAERQAPEARPAGPRRH